MRGFLPAELLATISLHVLFYYDQWESVKKQWFCLRMGKVTLLHSAGVVRKGGWPQPEAPL
ncbi:hypothetical protein EOV40_002205 [Acetobacter oryzoeni]|uniref:Uncharacterized protein n=1 Tax=Acetobacter oryzoeni TaxID=2500548 RepID=A0A5B9GLX6_9PROT|nr:hypothetical protein EOV40_002205 [Acetobacter oryzoeni]